LLNFPIEKLNKTIAPSEKEGEHDMPVLGNERENIIQCTKDGIEKTQHV